MPESAKFISIDLFAGIGGFHAALSAYGGTKCEWAVETDKGAASVDDLYADVAPGSSATVASALLGRFWARLVEAGCAHDIVQKLDAVARRGMRS